MAKFKKIVVCILMTIVWLVMLFMVIPMHSIKGQIATVFICLSLNTGLAAYYSCIDHKPATLREWFRM